MEDKKIYLFNEIISEQFSLRNIKKMFVYFSFVNKASAEHKIFATT